MNYDQKLLALRVGLTVIALEFFGPPIRDLGGSHALNPEWVGHARVHLVWLLGFMVFSGIANIYLIWFRRPFDLRDLGLSAAWQCCNLGGFWVAYFLAPFYDGVIAVEGVHTHVMGVDENVLAFSMLSIAMAGMLVLLRNLTAESASVGR